MDNALSGAVVLFLIGFGVAYAVTSRRSQAVRVQAGMVLGMILSLTPVIVAQVAG